MMSRKKWGWIAALGVGIALLGYPLIRSMAPTGIPGWQQVNAAAESALAHLDEASVAAGSAGSGGKTTNDGLAASPEAPESPKPELPKSAADSPGADEPELPASATVTPNPQTPRELVGSMPRPSENAENDSRISTSGNASTSSDQATGLLDLNRATAAELEGLPGIGPSKAEAIVAYRLGRSGGFGSVKELLEVKGIGPKIFAQISGLVSVG